MSAFTPWSSLAGGVLIGASASLLLLANGRVAGISGILGGLVQADGAERSWRLAFLGGLAAGGIALAFVLPSAFGPPTVSLPWVVVAGILVGFGTRLGGGCTSGHGVCGLSRGSPRSAAATGTFMAVGALVVFLLRHVLQSSG